MNILFISNGHGEDLNAGLIIDALHQRSPSARVFALPLVGEGKAYQNRNIAAIAPTQPLPSGGLIYTGWLTWCRDIGGGLLGLTLRQIRALWKQKQEFDFLLAIGDIVPLAFAYISGRPYGAFLVSTSAHYEGTLRVPWLTIFFLRSPRCRIIFTRDKFTETDLHHRGLKKAVFAGYPIMDALQPSGQNLPSPDQLPLIALLPGSRCPEALQNLAQLLPLCEAIAQGERVEFWVALVPAITEANLETLAQQEGWQYHQQTLKRGNGVIHCSWHQFADILQGADLVLGMAGTAVEQAVGLGKPVLQIPGYGPQFTYGFAEAQMRLLGPAVVTVGRRPDEPNLIAQARAVALEILQAGRTPVQQQQWLDYGRERVGEPGGSLAIADWVLEIGQSLAQGG